MLREGSWVVEEGGLRAWEVLWEAWEVLWEAMMTMRRRRWP